jgi:hypothetical protein
VGSLVVWVSKPHVDGFRVWASKSGAVLAGIGGGTWRHHEACVQAKLSHKGRVAVGCFYLKLDHYAPEVKWFSKISRGMLECVIASINKRWAAPN